MKEDEAIRALKTALLLGNEAGAVEALRFLSQRCFMRTDGSEDVQEFALYLAGILIRIVHVGGGTIREAAGTDPLSLLALSRARDKNDWVDVFERWVRRLAAIASKNGSYAQQAAIGGILAYLDNELTNPNLSLRAVAEQFGMHPSSLSRLFKQAQGMSFSSCLRCKRMERAKLLLGQGHPVAEIAARLGYSDRNHFCRLFRQFWGIPPSQWKDRVYGSFRHRGFCGANDEPSMIT